MRLSRKLATISAVAGAWSYSHAWLSALSTSERVQVLANCEACIAGLIGLAMMIAAVFQMSEEK